jgi:hypothetical protein
MLANRERLDAAMARLEGGALGSIGEFLRLLEEVARWYEEDAWAWSRSVAEERIGKDLDSLSQEEIADLRTSHRKLEESLTKKILADGEKEFDDVARLGYGADTDGVASARDADFEAVRGSAASNSFITGLRDRLGRSAT